MCPEPFDKLRTALVEGHRKQGLRPELVEGHNSTPAKALTLTRVCVILNAIAAADRCSYP